MFTKVEIEEAYQNLRNYFYYEKYDIATRYKIFNWSIENVSNFTDELNNNRSFEKYINQISLKFYPKTFEEKAKTTSQNYYSNFQLDQSAVVSNFMIFIDAPVELHILSVLWIKSIGRDLDSELGENCFGNRLLSYSNSYKKLFKKYNNEYRNWWKGALDTSKTYLENKKNVSILTFDIKSFYHSVEFDFDKIVISGQHSAKKQFLNTHLKNVHIAYKKLLIRTNHPGVNQLNTLLPLPIGLMSSFILANNYLKEFDEEIIKTKPQYYGRYVDDIILVYTSVKRLRYKNNKPQHFILKHFHKMFSLENEKDIQSDLIFNSKKYTNLKLQEEKIYLYELSYKNSPSIINVLIEEQKQRSSEYKFLSDINDDNFTDFESVLFEKSFDFDDGNKANFKEPNEDKFKMTSFIAKLTQKVIEFGPKYKEEEIVKVYKFFKGKYYVKHFTFWEKILTLFWVSEKYKLFFNAIKQIKRSIGEISIEKGWSIEAKEIKNDLLDYLDIAAKLAVNLNPNGCDSNYRDKNVCTREHFSRFQFLQYTKAYLVNELNLLSIHSLEELKQTPHLLEIEQEKVPTGKTFSWCYMYKFFYYTFNDLITDISQEEHLKEALILYNNINLANVHETEVWNIENLNNLNSERRSVYQINIPSKNQKKKEYRSCLINQFVDSKNFRNSLDGDPIFGGYRARSLRHKLDEIASIENIDLVVKPELAIPYPSLSSQVFHSCKFEYSLNSGVEFISSKTTGYNFIITTLPCRIDETFRDCVPIIRIKNKYTYRESKMVEEKELKVPLLNQHVFFLFRWKGLYFANYYCFELTSIEDRSIFKSIVDLIIAPIWNKDGHYFKAISDSLVRDIHCYYLQSNTSQFADTRVSQPSKSMFANKSSVKGGTVEKFKHNFNLVINDLDIEKLRHFQTLKFDETQVEEYSESNIFKPLPPGWNYDNVKKRINNQSINDEIVEEGNEDDLPF